MWSNAFSLIESDFFSHLKVLYNDSDDDADRMHERTETKLCARAKNWKRKNIVK